MFSLKNKRFKTNFGHKPKNLAAHHIRSKLLIVLTISLTTLLYCCGYKFSGGGDLPGGIKKISIGVFENRTNESGLEIQFPNDLIYHFGRFQNIIITNKDNSEAHLTGIIKSVSTDSLSYETPTKPTEQRIFLRLDVKLTSTSGELLWSANSVTDYETYEINTDKAITQANKKSALKTLSNRLAERIFYQITDNF
jgi:outer membrane lipopolysaccharide assembly protein LptE/RlpB